MSDYHRSQASIAQAERYAAAGDGKNARRLFAEAAAMQRAFVDGLSGEFKPKTKSVYTVSVVTLLRRAGDSVAAESFAREALAQPWLLPECAERLRTILASVA